MGIYLGAEELSTGGAASAGSFPKRFIAGTGEITWPNNENIYPPQGIYPWTVPTEIKTVIDAGGSYPVRLLMVGGGHNSSDNYMGEVKDIIYDLTSSNYDTGSTTTISATVGDVLGKSGISGVAPSPATSSVNIPSYTNTSAMTGLSVALPSGTKFDSNGYPFIKSIQLWKRAGASWGGDIRYVNYGGSGFTTAPTLGSTESVWAGGGLLSFANNANQPWDGTYTIRVAPTGNANAYATFEISYNLNTGNMDFSVTAVGSSITNGGSTQFQLHTSTPWGPVAINYENALIPSVFARGAQTTLLNMATYPTYTYYNTGYLQGGYGPHGFSKYVDNGLGTVPEANRTPGSYQAQGYVEIQWF